MFAFLHLLLHIMVSPFKTRARLEAEIILLRHQVNVLRRRLAPKPKLTVADRLLFVWLYRLFPSVLAAINIVQPETIIRWHRTGFRLYWRWKSRSRGGRPGIPPEVSPGGPAPDPRHERGEPALGCTTHPWRTAEARHRSRSVDGRQIHCEERARAVADLEDLPAQPCGRNRRDGLPHRADGRLSIAFRFSHPQARTAAADIPERNGQSHGGVDRP